MTTLKEKAQKRVKRIEELTDELGQLEFIKDLIVGKTDSLQRIFKHKNGILKAIKEGTFKIDLGLSWIEDKDDWRGERDFIQLPDSMKELPARVALMLIDARIEVINERLKEHI